MIVHFYIRRKLDIIQYDKRYFRKLRIGSYPADSNRFQSEKNGGLLSQGKYIKIVVSLIINGSLCYGYLMISVTLKAFLTS